MLLRVIRVQKESGGLHIIGSGPGGLTAAVALAQAGKKVLVLEQHNRPGGLTAAVALAQVGRLPWRARPGWSFSPRTEFDGLYLCGASTLSHGVAGVTQ